MTQDKLRAGMLKFRKTTGASQYELAKFAGLARSQVSEFECGHIDLSPEQLEAVKDAMWKIWADRLATTAGAVPCAKTD
jgi:transcriptional regulator with XRE-family HTH domain